MGNKLRVLIVEDSEDDAELTLLELRRAGYQTEAQRVETRAEMEAALKDQSWDLILSDHSLPQFSGLEALKLFKEFDIDIPFMIISGTIGEGLAIEMMKAGVHDYLIKGSLKRLSPALERELREAENRRERRRAEKVQTTAYQVAQLANAATRLDDFFQGLQELLGNLIPTQNFYIALYDPREDLVTFPYFQDQYEKAPAPRKDQRGLTEYVLRTGKSLLATPETHQKLRDSGEVDLIGPLGMEWIGVPLKSENRVIGMMAAQIYHEESHFTEKDITALEFVANQVELVVARKQVEEYLRASEQKFSKAFYTSPDWLLVTDAQTSAIIEINQGFTDLTGYTKADVEGKTILEIDIWENLKDKEHVLNTLKEHGEILNYEIRLKKKDGTSFYGLYSAREVEINGELCYLSILRDITQRISAEQQIAHQVRQLAALRSIDAAITSGFDMSIVLNTLLDKVMELLKVDAATVLILDRQNKTLEFATGRGFKTQALRHTRLRLGEGFAGQAALQQRIFSTDRLHESPDHELMRSPLLQEEGFKEYMAIPLIARRQVLGVLEIFQRSHAEPDEDWLNFLEALVGQAAIAIDNGTMFTDLQTANTRLMFAYDDTIQGWARALELRDVETEGHSKRVVDLTLTLCKNMGLPAEDLIHVQRGALLHDIGKMGIPDSILLKAGPLSDEEWVVMRQHPVYAYNLLNSIPYLRPALDIPYCHHEKWDGTGYPRGLKGEAIPLPARIFSVVDVWDALSSNRPYRGAWDEERTLKYIIEQSGKQFDPHVVEAFVRLIRK